MRFLKRAIPAAAIAAALCSCAGNAPQIIDYTLADEAQTYLITEQETMPETVIPASAAAFPYLGEASEQPEHSDDTIYTVPAVTAAELPAAEVTARDADKIPESHITSEASSAPETVPPLEEEQADTLEPAEYSDPAEKTSVKQQLSRKKKKYTYEYQKSNGSLSILGPNLVYVGETFDFDHYYPDQTGKSDIHWTLGGNIGSISENGVFIAEKKGTCTLTVVDRANGTFASLTVHCINSADDVDFIPLVNNIPIANKTYPLPKDYDPGLDPRARSAFMQLQLDAAAEGLHIFGISDYRSYDYQTQVYAGWKAMYGEEADLVSARPGFSEHQLGLAIDVNSPEYAFADTPEGKWLAEHCADYGFIIRYPSYASKQYTGYSYEPWHIRYLGKALAKQVTETGMTLEECLKIDSYYR